MGALNLLVLTVLICLPALSKAQGCSDAGFCTVSTLQNPESGSDSLAQKNQLKNGISHGLADHRIFIWSAYLEYNRTIGKRFGIDGKVVFLSQQGKETASSGLSDLFINGKYTGIRNTVLTGGFKFPLSNGNKSIGGLALPLDYQSSLGTFDFITGVSYRQQQFRFTAAVQQPLTQNNNQFSNTADSSFNAFQSTNGFHRKGDALLRVAYQINAGKNWKLTPGLLSIYHLGQDSYLTSAGTRQLIHGSEGLTLNATLFVQYNLGKSRQLELSMGTPLIARVARPDGLTRKYILTLEYKWSF